MNPSGFNSLSNNSSSGCTDFVTAAERELSAFFRAVTELFGTEQAELSAEDWLHEFTAMDGVPASTRRLRQITAKASTRLAHRVNASSLVAELQSL
jgi:hypothetical protein